MPIERRRNGEIDRISWRERKVEKEDEEKEGREGEREIGKF